MRRLSHLLARAAPAPRRPETVRKEALPYLCAMTAGGLDNITAAVVRFSGSWFGRERVDKEAVGAVRIA
jgi:hypothetical protein